MSVGEVHRAHKSISVQMLGGFRVNSWTPDPTPGSAWRIIAYLALYGPATRQRIAGTFWPEATQQRALGALRSGLWRLRREFPELVDAKRGALRLKAPVTTDVEEVVEMSGRILGSETYVPDDPAPLFRGEELIPEWHDDWVVAEREHLRQLRLQTLDALGGRLLDTGRFGLALRACTAVLDQDPLRESAHRQLIQIHLQQGNLAQARRQFKACANLLATELGVGPSAATRDLFLMDERMTA